jgi:hypothetical protein
MNHTARVLQTKHPLNLRWCTPRLSILSLLQQRRGREHAGGDLTPMGATRKRSPPRPILLNRLCLKPRRQILPPDFSLTLSIQKFLGIGPSNAGPANVVKGN